MEHMDFGDGGIISVKEARKLLGAAYERMVDDEVMGVVCAMSDLSAAVLDWQNSSTKLERGV